MSQGRLNGYIAVESCEEPSSHHKEKWLRVTWVGVEVMEGFGPQASFCIE